MKLISLNIWGGCLKPSLLAFITAHPEIDIWCFQEVYHKAEGKISTDDRQVSLDIFTDIAQILPAHDGYFRPAVGDLYGLATFIRKDITVFAEGEVIIHENPEYSGKGAAHPRNLQWLKCEINQQSLAIINVHGLWNGQGKTDTPARIQQSEKIKTFLASLALPQVLCGDFNLRPDTESLAIIAKDMRDLIKEYGITSTRTSLYPKIEKFADYIFVTEEIKIKAFAVLPDEVSDHSALYLDFALGQ